MARLPDDPKLRDEIIRTRIEQAKRLKEYVTQKATGSVHNLINSMGKNSYYDMYRKMEVGKRNFAKDFLIDLAKHDPELNIKWLMYGQGYMFQSKPGTDTRQDTPATTIKAGETNSDGYTNQYVVTDNSMAPNILKGDVLTFSNITDGQQPVFGELFLIQTKTSKLIRILWLVADQYILSPYDKARTQDISVAKSEVISIHPIVKITRNL